MLENMKDEGAELKATDKQGRTILHHASMNGNVEVVTEILKQKELKGLNTKDGDGWTPLHWPCRKEHNEEVLRIFLGEGSDPKQPTNDQWTPA
jgi:ankyrin repeat protein